MSLAAKNGFRRKNSSIEFHFNSLTSRMTKQRYKYTTVQMPDRHIFVFFWLQGAPSKRLVSSNLWIFAEVSDLHATTQDSASKR